MVWKWVARGNIKYILQMELDSPLGLMLLCLGNVTTASLASHTPCREEGSGHTAITGNTIIGQSHKIIRC